jgi:hypothetical protein
MRTSFSIASLVSLEAKKKTADLFGVRGGKGSMLYRLCCLPVNAAIPAEAPKEDQDEANKDEEQDGRHVRHQAPAQGNIMQALTVGYGSPGDKSSD